jgi:hypothetical protein
VADRYWVGGSGSWNSTTKWATSSGGASGASVPTSTDNAIFDANSGSGAVHYTVTVTASSTCANLTFTPVAANGVTQFVVDTGFVIAGTFSTSGTQGNRRAWFYSSTYGLLRDMQIATIGTVTDVDFRDIRVTGAGGTLSGTRLGDLKGCSGITFDAPKTVYWNLAAGGNWSATAWAATSGGAVSTNNFPLAQDTAIIENTGLNTSATVTWDNVITYSGTLDMSTRSNAMTFATGTTTPTIYGDWKNGAGVTFTGTGIITFSGRNTQTITSSGKTFTQPLTVDSYGGTVQLADALNIGATTLTVTNGTFSTQNFNVTAGVLSSSNSNVRAIQLGSSTVTLSVTGAVSFTTSTNLTLNAGTSQITLTDPAPTFAGGTGLTFYNLTFSGIGAGSIATFTGTSVFNNVSVTSNASAGLVIVTFQNNQTIDGTLTVAGASAVRRIFLRSNTIGTTRTLTVNSLSADDCDFRDITIAGTAAGSSPTRAGDCGGNSGVTFPSTKTVYWNLSGAQNWSATGWATTSGGSPALNNFPLAQDTAVFDNTGSVTGTITINAAWNIGTFDASARTSAMTLTTSTIAPFIYGDWKFGTGVTSSSTTGAVTFGKRGTQTITSNGVTFGCPVTINAASGTTQLADALALGSTRTLTVTSGTFDAVSYSVTTGLFTLSAATGTLQMGSGTWTLSGTGAVWTNTGGTFYKSTANIVLSDTSTTARTFAGGGRSYNKLTIGGTTGISTLTITGNNQFTELASTKTVAHTIALGTTTQTLGAWTVTGAIGNVVTVTGTATVTIAGARVTGVDYLALGTTVVSATSPAEFYAGANSTGGTNAILTAAPAGVTRYWVGGSGTWDATTTSHWSATSGGATGASVPTSADAVVFDSASNATAYTVTCTATQLRCGSLTISGPASGNVTWAGTAPLAIHGDVSLPATGITRSYTGGITLTSSSTGRTFTTNGIVLASAVTVNGVGCGWTLGSAIDIGSSVLTVTNGSFSTGNYAVTAQSLSSDNAHSRTITLGSSTVTLTSTANTVTFTSSLNLTFSAGTSSIVCSGGVTGFTFDGGGQTFSSVSFSDTSKGAHTIAGANTFNNLTIAGQTSGSIFTLSLSNDQTITGTLTISAGTNATGRVFFASDTIGTTRTLTCAAFSGTDVDFRDITIAGAAAPVSGTRLGDCKGNSGITFAAGANKYWNLAGGGNWSATGWATSSGGAVAANNFPLAQDTCYFEATGLNSGSTVTVNAAYNIGTIDMSARTSNTMTLATGTTTPTIYGNWINGTGTTLTGTGTLTFAGRGSQTITSVGRTFTQPITVDTPGGSATLQDAFLSSYTTNAALLITSGSFNANNYNVTLSSGGVFSSNSNTRTIGIGSGLWILGVSAGNAWGSSTSTNLTVTGTGTIRLTSASAKTFAGGGAAYTSITIDQGGAGTLTITGNNTLGNISNSYSTTGATTIAMGTTTQTVSQFTATGTVGNVLTLQGTSASNPCTLIYTGAGDVTGLDYLTITGVRAYPL